MNSLTSEYLNRLKFSYRQASTLKKIGEYQGKQMLFARQTPEALESLKHIAIIESSESSNRLEGITAPHERVKKIVERKDQPENRSEQEIAGYRDALSGIHESAVYMSFTTDTILSLHKTMYQYMAEPGGIWKNADNEIIELNPDGSFKRVRFETTPASETPEAMEQLVERYADAVNVHYIEPLVIIPLTVLDFLCIHPFRDGNGRVARLFTLMLLYHFDFQAGKYISLERIFEESKVSYYDSLEKSSKGWHEGRHDAFPWLEYFWGTLLKAYHELEDRVKDIRSGKGCKTDQVVAAVGKKLGPFAISDIEGDCPLVSRDMIRIVLRQLRDEGVIEVRGKGRGAKWIHKK